MAIIYLLTSPSGKHYVGQSVNSFNVRMYKHKSAAKLRHDGGCVALNTAIRKYGFDNFKKEILLECDEDMLDYFECKMIKTYNSLAPYGYNLMTGGNSNKHLSEETKQKMSQSALKRDTKSYRKSDETKELPKYLVRIDNKYQKGYKISKHPKCKCKYFADTSKTLEENYQDAIYYMNLLDTTDLEHKAPEKTLPQGIQKMGHGFRIYIKNEEGKLYTKNFGSKNQTTDELLDDAIEHLNSLQL